MSFKNKFFLITVVDNFVFLGDAENDAFANVMKQYARILDETPSWDKTKEDLLKDSDTSTVQDSSNIADTDISIIAPFDENTGSCNTPNVEGQDILNATDDLLTDGHENVYKSRDIIFPNETSAFTPSDKYREETDDLDSNNEKEIMKPVHSLVKFFENKNGEPVGREQDDATAITFQLNL